MPADLRFTVEDLLNNALMGDTLSLGGDAINIEIKIDKEKLAKNKVSNN